MITAVTVTNVKGLGGMQEFKLSNGLNYLFGDYGIGKSSFVRALEWAIVGASDAKTLLKVGEKYMEVSITMDGGVVIEATYTRNGSTAVNVFVMGGKVSRPREWLKTNIAPYFLSNVGYISLANEKRYETFMATLPTISEERLMTIIPKGLHEHIKGIDYSKPSPVVIKKVIEKLNVLKKGYVGLLTDMKSVLSADVRNISEFEHDVEIIRLKEELDRLSPYYAGVPDNVEEEIKKYKEEEQDLNRRYKETVNALSSNKKYTLLGEVDYCPVGLKCQYSSEEIRTGAKVMLKKSEIVRSLVEVKTDIEHDLIVNQKNQKMFQKMLEEGITSKKLFDELYTSIKSNKEKMEYELKLYRQSNKAIDKMTKYEKLIEEIVVAITKLKEEIKGINITPDIEDISVKGKTIYFNNIPLSESCGTEQLITVANLVKQLNNGYIFVIDDADLLTERSFNRIKEILKGWQIILLVHSSDSEMKVEQKWIYH